MPWKSTPNIRTANTRFPVVDKLQVPVRGLFFIILGFAVLFGPVNMILLARTNRRVWLLWTVPVISVLTCLLVFVYSLLAEGITPSIRLEGFTVLDEPGRRATTLGMAAYYCPLTASEGLHFDPDTELTLCVDRFGYTGSGAGRDIDWTRDQHLESGWAMARVPAHFIVRKSEVRRERLQTMEKPDGNLSVVNGLGEKIAQLWLADRQGNILEARDIPAGQQVVLEKPAAPARAGGSPDQLRRLYVSTDWAGLVNVATTRIEGSVLRRMCRTMMAAWPAPRARAACTNSRSRSERASPRTTRQ